MLEGIRFLPEKELFDALKSDRHIKDYLKKNEHSIFTSSTHVYVDNLRQSFELTNKSSPYISNLLNQCIHSIGSEHFKKYDVRLFLNSDQTLNAACSKYKNSIVISLNAGCIKSLSDDELKFVIGHELGHAIFDHHDLPAYGICNNRGISPSKTIKLMDWSRRAEISADRVGLLCTKDKFSAKSALVKLSTGGIFDPFIQIDEESFLQQLELSKEIDPNDCDLSYSTHPLSPLRVSAISLFSAALNNNNHEANILNKKMLSTVNQDISNLLETHFVEETKEKSSDDFQIFVILYVALQDANLEDLSKDKSTQEELLAIYDLFDELKIKEFLKSSSSATFFSNLFKSIVKMSEEFSSQPKTKKCNLIEKAIAIARADEVLSSKEKKALIEICDLIGVDRKFIDQVLFFLD